MMPNWTWNKITCKKELADNIIKYLEPIRERRRYYETHKDEVQKILEDAESLLGNNKY